MTKFCEVRTPKFTNLLHQDRPQSDEFSYAHVTVCAMSPQFTEAKRRKIGKQAARRTSKASKASRQADKQTDRYPYSLTNFWKSISQGKKQKLQTRKHVITSKKGMNIKNLGRTPPSQPPPQRTPNPANSLFLEPLFPSKYRKKAYIKNFEGGLGNSLCWISSCAFLHLTLAKSSEDCPGLSRACAGTFLIFPGNFIYVFPLLPKQEATRKQIWHPPGPGDTPEQVVYVYCFFSPPT